MFLIGGFIGILVPIIFILAPSFYWLVPAFLLMGVADGLIQPAWTSMYANSVRNENRGTIYGIANVFIQGPTLLAGITTGYIISLGGGLNVKGIRPIYYLQAVLLVLAIIIVWSQLEIKFDETHDRTVRLGDMLNEYRKILRRNGVRSWIGMKCLASLGVGLAGPFWMLYAAQVLKTSALIIGYMITIRSLTQILISPYSGALTDKVGRKKMIIGGRILMYFSTMIFLFFGGRNWVLFIAWILMGITDSTGIAWQAQEVELVSPEERGRITGLSVAGFNLLAVPGSILGGLLWDNVNVLAPFVVMIAVDGLIRMPILYKYVPDSKENNKGYQDR
jgi:MFS family permease